MKDIQGTDVCSRIGRVHSSAGEPSVHSHGGIHVSTVRAAVSPSSFKNVLISRRNSPSARARVPREPGTVTRRAAAVAVAAAPLSPLLTLPRALYFFPPPALFFSLPGPPRTAPCRSPFTKAGSTVLLNGPCVRVCVSRSRAAPVGRLAGGDAQVYQREGPATHGRATEIAEGSFRLSKDRAAWVPKQTNGPRLGSKFAADDHRHGIRRH